MAIDYAYEVRAASPDTSIFWVHGSTKARFEESYRSIADILALPGRKDPRVNVLGLVRDWLQMSTAAPWLLILDNADDNNTFFDKADPSQLAVYLPKADHGKILITSRNMNAAQKLTGSQKAIMRLPAMDSSQAVRLFQKKLGVDVGDGTALDLVRALDCVPLAIDQAAAYISKRSPRVSARSYVDDLLGSEATKAGLLDFDPGNLRRYENVSNSIVMTWQLTFDQISRERPSAANLLSLMSFFHPQGIPDYVLSGYTEPSVNIDDAKNGECFEDDLDILRDYSLVTMSETTGFFDMHPLVQFCTQAWLKKIRRLGPVGKTVSAINFGSLPTGRLFDVVHLSSLVSSYSGFDAATAF